MSPPARRALVPLALAGLVLAAGCSLPGSGTGSGGSSPVTSAPPADPPSSAPASSAPASPDPGQPTPADPSASGGPSQLGDPFATRESAIGKEKVVLELYALQREGSVSHLNFTMRSSAEGTSAQVSQVLGDANGKVGDSTYDSADGIALVDGKNAKLYLVASDGAGTCLCSRSLSGVFLKNDVPQLFSATFAAPPADVTTVDVRMPTFGTVKGVPVQ